MGEPTELWERPNTLVPKHPGTGCYWGRGMLSGRKQTKGSKARPPPSFQACLISQIQQRAICDAEIQLGEHKARGTCLVNGLLGVCQVVYLALPYLFSVGRMFTAKQ